MSIFLVDIDSTICYSVEDDYAHSIPCRKAIEKVNKLFDEGNYIKLFTGRGSGDNTDWKAFTEKQVKNWGVKYHELIMGKPSYDVSIDDKSTNTADWLGVSDTTKEVVRDWGKEYWIVNCDEYCSKLLFLAKGAQCGIHYHNKKKETFYCLKGQLALTVGEKEFVLDQFSKPITIMPSEKHSFKGLSNSIILEVSTHHEDSDSVMLSQGHTGGTCVISGGRQIDVSG